MDRKDACSMKYIYVAGTKHLTFCWRGKDFILVSLEGFSIL